MADKSITNPQGAFGYTDLEQTDYQNAPSFKTSGVVSAKNVVVIGTNGTVAKAATGSTASLCIGIALEAGVTGDTIKVAVQGIVTGMVAEGAIAASDILKRSGTTAAAVAATATPGVGEGIGVAIAASSGGLVTGWIHKGV